jgi:hypothetical protein
LNNNICGFVSSKDRRDFRIVPVYRFRRQGPGKGVAEEYDIEFRIPYALEKGALSLKAETKIVLNDYKSDAERL